MKGWRRIHGYVQCSECDWNFSDNFGGGKQTHYLGRKAQEHANKTGHKVTAEIGLYKDFRKSD
jgi:hypothetical protein